jgi:hypothetical protein
MMMAGIDILFVHLIERFEEQRINLFAALSELRRSGYDVPKVAPFLDPFGIWPPRRVDVSTEQGKDEVVRHYLRFFDQYFSVNTDPHASSYLARIENRVVLASWWVYSILENIEAFKKADIEDRLRHHFDLRTSIFDGGIHMVSTALVDPDLSFSDERVVFFSGYSYCVQAVHGGVHVYHVQAGYWDQNIRQPGYHLPRHGGRQFKAAWDYVLYQCAPVHRVYVESWNEYDESSGIYAANPAIVQRSPSNQSMVIDKWSESDDPFEYIRTNARSVAVLKDLPEWDSCAVESPRRYECRPDETIGIRIVFRNTGSKLWTADSMPLPQVVDPEGACDAIAEAFPEAEDLQTLEGVFRGAPVPYRVILRSPAEPGDHTLSFRLQERKGERFGEALEVRISVK